MAGTIPASQLTPVFTAARVAKYDELQEIKVNNFFASFFPALPCPERYPVIDVRRGSEQVAVDIMRGHQGQRVQISKFSQKAFDTFYYKFYTDLTELTGYFNVFGSTAFAVNEMATLANEAAVSDKAKSDMIKRAIEVQCASVLENGTITSLRDSSIVDFKRQAGSMEDVSTMSGGQNSYWDAAGHNPFLDLRRGYDWLKTKGKYSGEIVHAIVGLHAWQAFRNNDVVKARLGQFNNRRDVLMPSQRNSLGADYQGMFDIDGAMVQIWTYNDVYDTPTFDTNGNPITGGASVPYMKTNKVYMTVDNPGFKTLYGAIPQVGPVGTNTSALIVGTEVFTRYANPEGGYDRSYLQSAPLAVPITVDRIYTATVTAS